MLITELHTLNRASIIVFMLLVNNRGNYIDGPRTDSSMLSRILLRHETWKQVDLAIISNVRKLSPHIVFQYTIESFTTDALIMEYVK